MDYSNLIGLLNNLKAQNVPAEQITQEYLVRPDLIASVQAGPYSYDYNPQKSGLKQLTDLTLYNKINPYTNRPIGSDLEILQNADKVVPPVERARRARRDQEAFLNQDETQDYFIPPYYGGNQ